MNKDGGGCDCDCGLLTPTPSMSSPLVSLPSVPTELLPSNFQNTTSTSWPEYLIRNSQTLLHPPPSIHPRAAQLEAEVIDLTRQNSELYNRAKLQPNKILKKKLLDRATKMAEEIKTKTIQRSTVVPSLFDLVAKECHPNARSLINRNDLIDSTRCAIEAHCHFVVNHLRGRTCLRTRMIGFQTIYEDPPLTGQANWSWDRNHRLHCRMDSLTIPSFWLEVTITKSQLNHIKAFDGYEHDPLDLIKVSGNISSKHPPSRLIARVFEDNTLRIDDVSDPAVWVETSIDFPMNVDKSTWEEYIDSVVDGTSPFPKIRQVDLMMEGKKRTREEN